MNLGAFSISLNVKDLAASRAFYDKARIPPARRRSGQGLAGDAGAECGDRPVLVIGLFQGMFDRNMLTFCPGWDADAQPLDAFTDVRALQRQAVAAGLVPDQSVDETGSGPGYFTLTDPDGNPILIDQHV